MIDLFGSNSAQGKFTQDPITGALVPMVVETFGRWDSRADEVFAFIAKGSGARASAGAEPGVSSTDLDIFFYQFNGTTLVTVGALGDINLDLPLA